MARELDAQIQAQINAKILKPIYILTIAGTDVSDYLIDFDVSYDKQFGSASGSFTLLNANGEFGEEGDIKISVGDRVILKQKYDGSSIEWDTFYGFVDNREISKDGSSNRTIIITCFDYLAELKNWDIDLRLEADKYLIEDEILKPNYLPSPNDSFAQVFNFANANIAQLPPPILTVRLKDTLQSTSVEDETKYNGFDINYDDGQVTLGSPFNVLDNYNVIAKSYYHYPVGIYVEDVIKTILTQSNAYGKFLFGEDSAQDVIDNHLTSDLNTEEGVSVDYLIPNAGSSTIVIRHQLAQNYYSNQSGYDPTKLYLDSVDGLPNSGTGNINGDLFTWTSIESGNCLAGIPTSGEYSLSDHDTNAIMKYSATYEAGRVWYLKYSNLITTLTSANFTIPGGTLSYFDKRYGRIILTSAISVASVVTCNINYYFNTLQASGIEINYISVMSREKDNALSGIEDVLKYVAPNYLVRTQGNQNIWSGYVTQKSISDYELNLIQNLKYIEDSDLYTHTVFYGKNKNPANILYDPSVSFVTSGGSFRGEAVQTELIYESTSNGWHKFVTSIGDAGKIVSDNYTPILYINGVQVDNRTHQQIRQPVTIVKTTTTTTSGGGGGCYITTATCKYLGLSEDCYVLKQLRTFRDEWLMNQENGKDLVNKYYETAPKIVKNIDSNSDKDFIYKTIWHTYIVPCLCFIEQGKYEETKELYIKAVNELSNLDSFIIEHKKEE